jgi:serine/threonine-protein kinase
MNPRVPASQTSAIEAMLAAGQWAEAAAALRAAGEPARAAAIYEKLWDFERAAACFAEADRPDDELKAWIDAKQPERALAVAERLAALGPEGSRRAATLFDARRQSLLAARFFERAGELGAAAARYDKAGAWLDCGRVYEALGDEAAAGRAYERATAPGEENEGAARAHLRLGELCERRGNPDRAAHHLQAAATHPATAALALAALPRVLAALGLAGAAQAALTRARALSPELAAGLADYLHQLAEDRRDAVARPRPASDIGAAGRDDSGALGAARHERGEQSERDSRLVGGRYRLGRLLGAGGSGRVHAAHDEVSGREVAIKLFFAASARDKDATLRFAREVQVCAALAHPNIVALLDVRLELGFYVMELMHGTLLARMTPRVGPAPLRRAAIEILAGLEAAHGRGVVHRDLKPANVFFDERGVAKLGDFGVAHLLDLGQTQTGGLIGTLAYMAPEQVTGAPITFAADLYGLGVTLFHALTGRLPLPGPDFIAQHLSERPPPPSAIIAELGPWDRLLERLLAKDPAARPESAAEVRRELEALATGARVVALALGGVGSSTSMSARRATTLRPAQDGGESPAQGTAPATSSPTPGAAGASRYQGETPLGETPASVLVRALDTTLSRSVVIERFAAGGPDPAATRRLVAAARSASPQLMRVLAFDRAAGVVVYEAPVGETLEARLLRGPLDAAAVARLVTDLGAALSPLHEAGVAHGAVSAARILVDDAGAVTLTLAGLPPPDPEIDAQTDVRAALDLATAAAGGIPLAALGELLPSDADQVALLCGALARGADLAALGKTFAHALARRARLHAHARALAGIVALTEPRARAAAMTRALALLAARGVPRATATSWLG